MTPQGCQLQYATFTPLSEVPTVDYARRFAIIRRDGTFYKTGKTSLTDCEIYHRAAFPLYTENVTHNGRQLQSFSNTGNEGVAWTDPPAYLDYY